MRDLNYQLKQLCHRNRDGSSATQAKREMSLSPDGSLVLVHQFIRQYVMAKILVDLTKTGKEVVVFVVGVNENRLQVQFMIKQGWMKASNVLSWSDIKRLASLSVR